MAGDGLEYETERVAGNSAMANPAGAMTHWKCTLSAGGSAVSFVVSLSEDAHAENAPTKDIALALLAADLSTLNQYPDRSAWIAELAGQTGLGADDPGLALAHDSLSDTAAEFEMNFGMDWRRVMAADFVMKAGSAPRV